MCGIVGFTGRSEAAPILLEGLRRLEYRGYDSAGLVTGTGNGLLLPVADGRLALGTWQGVYLCEHRDDGGARTLLVTVFGE